MKRSEVYFTNLRASKNCNLLQKLERLVKKAGIENIDFNNKFTAIKIHLGEPGNIAYLRPNFSKVIVDIIKSNGGKVFLTDCSTLYIGRRKNGIEHLDAAYENGYNPFATGCHVIIGDGIKGTDDIAVPIDGEYIKEAKIGRAIMDADIIISLTHFKGHELTGFGGTLKNIGMGAGSKAGKAEMHSSGKPKVIDKRCKGCKKCLKICAQEAISMNKDNKAVINHDLCVGCGRCIGYCEYNAISAAWDEANDILNKKIAEYTYAVVKDRPAFHISLVVDVSPFCDCHSENDVPIIPDVGMFASYDPVALDIACADAANKAPVIKGSIMDERCECDDHDHFRRVHPETNWMVCIDHAVKIGLGSKEYELIEV